MRVVKKQRKLLLLVALMVVLAQFNYVEPIPVDTSDLVLSSESGVAKDNSTTENDENLMKIQMKKKKQKGKKKKKPPTNDKEEEDVFGNIITDLAAIFASFLSTVEDVTKDNEFEETIEVLSTIAETGSKTAKMASEAGPDILKGALEIGVEITGIIKDVSSNLEKITSDLKQTLFNEK